MPDIKICNFNPEKSKLSASHTCSLFREHLSINAGSTFIFTDGSKANDAAGCAAIIGQSEYSAKLATFTFSYTAELIAILLVIKNVLNRHSGDYFTIFSDSKSALVALQSFYTNNPIILDIFYFLRRVFEKGKSITFCWSPGHVNIQGNEDADKAAKSAAIRNDVDFKSIPYLDTKFYSKKYIFNKF